MGRTGELGTQRRLAAIMVADIVGYSRLMEAAEEQTAHRAAACQELYERRLVHWAGASSTRQVTLASQSLPAQSRRYAARPRYAMHSPEAVRRTKLRLSCGMGYILRISSSEVRTS